jgi:hypothetical protein
MHRPIASAFASTAFIITLATSALAGPTPYGQALRDLAAAGHITPHGIWDSK